MVRILCIGDSHIPKRAKELPERIYIKLNEITELELFDYTFFTGDIIDFPKLISYLDLKTGNEIFVVMGNMDYYYGNRNAPLYRKLDVIFKNNQKMTLGLTHGDQISPRGDHDQLENLAIERKYDILISGHTHKEEVYLTDKGILLLNPGSVTGAWSFVASLTPSFIELDINEITKEIIVDLYRIDKNSREIIASKSKFQFKNNQITDSLI